jgi:uroporphyrinogen-III decarboxylase
MPAALSSAERVKLAYSGHEPDRVPIMFRATGPLDGRFDDQFERAEALLRMGADVALTLELPIHFEPRVSSRTWIEKTRRERVLHKEYQTPAGALHASVRLTEHGQERDIPLCDDRGGSRGEDFPIETERDLNALHYLLRDPAESDLTPVLEHAAHVRRQADRLGVIVQGNMPPAPLCLMSLLGRSRCVLGVRDEPELLVAVMVHVQQWTRRCLEVLLDLPIDVVYRSNRYETVDLFSARDIRDLFMPVLRFDAQLCKMAQIPLHCFAKSGIMPLLEDYAEAGVDVLSSLSPVGPEPMDLSEVKRRIGDCCCLMGGVDSHGPFLAGSPEEMEQTVLSTLRAMAPGGGYILSPAGAIPAQAAESSIAAFVEVGRRYGRYPLDLPG